VVLKTKIYSGHGQEENGMVLIGNEYLDKLFVQHVDDLQGCGSKPRTTFLRLRMAHTLRLLVTSGRGNDLAVRVQQRYACPLWVLVPEPIAGNTPADQLPRVPDAVIAYATPITNRTHPRGTEGYYHKPYSLSDYLAKPVGVLTRRPIIAGELIRFLANKLGGSHADEELLDHPNNVDAETLWFLNHHISIFGTGSVYALFDGVAPTVWRSLAPLRDEVASAYGGQVDL
jgi:hypothetical protein